MIPLELSDALEKDLSTLFHDYITQSEKRINIFKQQLPLEDDVSDGDESLFPFVVIKLEKGEIKGEVNTANIAFVAGIVDETSDRQGYKDAVNMINHIYLHITKNKVKPVCGLYSPLPAMSWELPGEDDLSHPFYFAALYTTWEAPHITEMEGDELC